jgi:superfamily I DNA and/or RNA helicase
MNKPTKLKKRLVPKLTNIERSHICDELMSFLFTNKPTKLKKRLVPKLTNIERSHICDELMSFLFTVNPNLRYLFSFFWIFFQFFHQIGSKTPLAKITAS